MSRKIKLSFLTILVLILINCGTVFGVQFTQAQIDNLNKISSVDITLDLDSINNIIADYENICVTIANNEYNIWFSDEILIYRYNDGYSRIGVTNGGSIRNNQIKYGAWNYYFTNYLGTFSNIYDATTGELVYDARYESVEGVLFGEPEYNKAYFNFTLNYEGITTLESINEDIGAYTYTYVNTGVSNIGNRYLKLGYLYIDQNYLISNLLTSVPIMTKYSMNLLNSWEYTLYEGVYTTGEKENGYLKYEIRIPIEYVSTPNYYNIFFRSRDTSIEQDMSIDFVLLNNTENSGTIGPIITPSGDTISGDEIKDETTLGDIQNTITEIFQKPNQEQTNTDAENSINQIKNNITEKLEENEIIGALDLAEKGFLDILKGEAGDFKISWEQVTYKDVALIPKGEVNFSKIARENESVGYVKTTLNTVLSAFMAFNILKTLYNLLMEMLGVSSPVINEVTTKDLNLNKGGKTP